MSEKLTVAELLARNAKAGGKNTSDRPRRRRNLDDGGVSVSELTGSIPVVTVDGEDDGAAGASTKTHGGHEADPEAEVTGTAQDRKGVPESGAAVTASAGASTDPKTPAAAAAPKAPAAPAVPTSAAAPKAPAVAEVSGFDQQPTIVQAVIPDSLLESPRATVPVSGPEDVEGARDTDVTAAAAADDVDDSDDGGAAVVSGAVAGGPAAAVDGEVDTDTDEDEATDGAGTTAVGGRTASTAATAAAAVPVAVAAGGDGTDDTTGTADDRDRDTDDTTGAGSVADLPETDDDEVIEYEDDSISWPALIGQAALAVVVGVLIFFGFTVLWDRLNTVLALVMALVVTFVCVGVVHALLRHRDTLILVLTFVVGLALTVGPRLVLSL